MCVEGGQTKAAGAGGLVSVFFGLSGSLFRRASWAMHPPPHDLVCSWFVRSPKPGCPEGGGRGVSREDKTDTPGPRGSLLLIFHVGLDLVIGDAFVSEIVSMPRKPAGGAQAYIPCLCRSKSREAGMHTVHPRVGRALIFFIFPCVPTYMEIFFLLVSRDCM